MCSPTRDEKSMNVPTRAMRTSVELDYCPCDHASTTLSSSRRGSQILHDGRAKSTTEHARSQQISCRSRLGNSLKFCDDSWTPDNCQRRIRHEKSERYRDRRHQRWGCSDPCINLRLQISCARRHGLVIVTIGEVLLSRHPILRHYEKGESHNE